MKSAVGVYEQQDIERLVARILRDLGNPEPPLNLRQVRDLLAVDLKYYSATDVSLFQEVAHRIRIANKQITSRPGLILDVLRKANLSGLWLPDNRHIYIDQEQPKPKHRWIEAHEMTHSFVPWHAQFLQGDNQLTLDPACHETIEAEANFGAGRLLFHGDRFSAEARDCADSFESIKALKARYGNTLTSTFWRFVEDRHPDSPAFGLISRHPRHPTIGGSPDGADVHHFVVSDVFRRMFSKTTSALVYASVQRLATFKSRGPVFEDIEVFVDDNGDRHTFRIEGFCNQHQLLTYGRRQGTA